MIDLLTAPDAPAAVGPYSAAVRAGGFVYCSGQTPLDPATGALVDGPLEAQTRQVFANIEAVLSAQGLGLADVCKATVFLVTMQDFEAMNGVYAEAFGSHRPARSTVAVAGLPLGARVEIEVVALDRS